jgi:FHA domain
MSPMGVLTAVLDRPQALLLVLVAVVVLLVALALIFRERIAALEFDSSKRQWRVVFGQQVRREEKKADAISRKIPASLSVPPVLDGTAQPGRDMVLEAWGAVRQAAYDGCIANQIPMTPGMGMRDAVRQLRTARGLVPDLVELVEFVDGFGREVAASPRLRPEDADAQAFWDLAHKAASWLAVSVLVPPPPPPDRKTVAPPVVETPRRRPTVVGGNFAPPSPGNPSVALVAIAGPMKGQQYPIDKSNYLLGRSGRNDLRATADDSVSSDHARLRYENGGLFLNDQGSLNGTFLNDQRVTATPVMVRQGDRIRLGESVFEVVGAAASPARPVIRERSDRPDRPETTVR